MAGYCLPAVSTMVAVRARSSPRSPLWVVSVTSNSQAVAAAETSVGLTLMPTPPAWLLCCASSAAAAPNAYSKVAQRTSARNREDGFRLRLGISHAPWLLELLWL